MTTLKIKTPGSYADIEDLPVGWVGEILDGTFYGSPRATSRHTRVQNVLTYLLGGPFDYDQRGPGGWIILAEAEVHLSGNVIVPDLCGWRRDRISPAETEPYPKIVPDWVCEVLSPSTHMLDRSKKMPKYHALGVPHAWLIDPSTRHLEIYERTDRGWLLSATHSGDEAVRAPPFEVVPLELSQLWWTEG